MSVFRVLEVDPDVRGSEPHLHAELTGREGDLAKIAACFGAVLAERRCRALTLIGEPGVGKTRLAEEFVARDATRAHVLRGRCPSYGEGIRFWPLAQVVRQAVGIPEGEAAEDVDRRLRALAPHTAFGPLAAVLGLSVIAPREEDVIRAVGGLLEALAAERAVVIVLDDIHWAEPSVLDLVEYLAARVRAPVFVLATARPEIRDRRSGWGEGSERSSVVELSPLAETDALTLASRLIGSAALSDAPSEIVRMADGNPLFIEELVAMLIEESALRGTDPATGSPRAPAGTTLPPAIHALLQARLDLLPQTERRILETASVQGTSFHMGAIHALTGNEIDEATLGAAIVSLLDRNFLRPERSAVPDERGLRFRHELIREVTYRSVPKSLRAQMHEGLAAWWGSTGGPDIAEYEAVLGHHLERACLLHRELGHVDDPDLHVRAAEHLASAGRRALERGDARSAAALLRRAVDLLPTGSPERTRLLWPLAEAQDLATGRLPSIGEELESSADSLGDEVLRQAGRLLTLGDRWTSDPLSLDLDEFVAVTREALAVLEAAGASGFAYWGWTNLATAYWYRGDMAGMLDASERVLRHLDRAERTPPLILIGYLGHALRAGTTPLTQAIQRLEVEMAHRTDDPLATAWLQANVAVFHAMQGRLEEARTLADATQRELEGLPQHVVDTTTWPASIALLAGDLDEAERGCRRDLEAAMGSGDVINVPEGALDLADVLARKGATGEAVTLIETARRFLPAYDLPDRIALCRIRARLLAADGRLGEAIHAAAEAVRLADRTDMTGLQGDCLLTLAEVQGAAGELDGALESGRMALERFERKGYTIRVAEARALLDRLGEGPPDTVDAGGPPP